MGGRRAQLGAKVEDRPAGLGGRMQGHVASIKWGSVVGSLAEHSRWERLTVVDWADAAACVTRATAGQGRCEQQAEEGCGRGRG